MMDNYSQEAWLRRAKPPVFCTTEGVIRKTSIGFIRHDPTNDTFSIFMIQFILLSFTSHVLYIILRPLKQPRFVCNALGGILMSPQMPMPGRTKFNKGKIFPPPELVLIKTVAYLGVIYYLFITAVKIDKHMILRTAKKASIIGISGFLLAFVIILCTSFKLPLTGERGLYFQCFLSATLSFTRFSHVAYLFDELDIMTSELGQLGMSSSMVCEIISWGWLFVPLTYRHLNHIKWVLLSVILLLFMSFTVRPLIRMIVKKTPEGKAVNEKYTVMFLLGALILAVIGDMIGALLIGVFIVGLMIPNGPPLGATLSKRIEHIAMDLFLPFFYVLVGYLTDVTTLDLKASRDIILLVSLGFLAKFVGAFLSAMMCQVKFWHAVLLGLMLNIRGPFDFWLYVIWIRIKDLGDQTYTVMVISQIIIMAIVTPLIELLYDFSVRVTASKMKVMKSIQVSSDDAELRILCCVQNEENVMGLISLIEACNPSISSPICAYVVHQNELVGRATPFITAYSEKLKRTTSRNSHHIMQAFINYSKNSYGFVRAKTFTMSAPYKSMHEYVCKLAQDQLVSLIIVPFHGNQEVDALEAAALQKVNRNIQLHAPCTVGILVDKGLSNCLGRSSSSSFSCSIVVVFIGGASDREALALATRMSGHPCVRVMVLQIIIDNSNKKEGNEEDIIDDIDKELDFASINTFKLKVGKNKGKVTHREVVVETIEDALNEIQMLEDKYNLIIVGQQHKTPKLGLDGAMLSWIENVELGVLGDMIASYDFRRVSTSVLVMQHLEVDREGPLFSCSNSKRCDYGNLLKNRN